MTPSIDAKQIDQHSRQLAGALHRWEKEPSAATVRALQASARQAQEHIDAWDKDGVYRGQQVKMIEDMIAHIGARLEIAHKEGTRL